MTPFSKTGTVRPLRAKHSIGNLNSEKESEVPYKKLLNETFFTVIATILIQEAITRFFFKK
ncbi:MAG: hypothetical protein FWE63_01955 [Bacteroidales bacterium]|nr:hypothetical protein [Bacteroidales bacterium]